MRRRLGLAADRAYGVLAARCSQGESARDDRVDLVTVATPNATHFEITREFLSAGFNVLCEKPMTMTVEEGEEIVRIAQKSGRICAVNYGYSGYSLVRHMRAMVARGDLGAVRVVVAEFAHGHHADAADADNPSACVGAMTRRKRACQRSSPIAAFTRCTWPAS